MEQGALSVHPRGKGAIPEASGEEQGGREKGSKTATNVSFDSCFIDSYLYNFNDHSVYSMITQITFVDLDISMSRFKKFESHHGSAPPLLTFLPVSYQI